MPLMTNCKVCGNMVETRSLSGRRVLRVHDFGTVRCTGSGAVAADGSVAILPEPVRRLLELATLLAPSHTDGFARVVKDMQRDARPESEIVKELVGALYDGLNYGNWP